MTAASGPTFHVRIQKRCHMVFSTGFPDSRDGRADMTAPERGTRCRICNSAPKGVGEEKNYAGARRRACEPGGHPSVRRPGSDVEATPTRPRATRFIVSSYSSRHRVIVLLVSSRHRVHRDIVLSRHRLHRVIVLFASSCCSSCSREPRHFPLNRATGPSTPFGNWSLAR
jgi:hypothetical protein